MADGAAFGSQAKLPLEQMGLPEVLGRILSQSTINVVLNWLWFSIAVVLGLYDNDFSFVLSVEFVVIYYVNSPLNSNAYLYHLNFGL